MLPCPDHSLTSASHAPVTLDLGFTVWHSMICVWARGPKSHRNLGETMLCLNETQWDAHQGVVGCSGMQQGIVATNLCIGVWLWDKSLCATNAMQ